MPRTTSTDAPSATAAADPVAGRIRERRLALGWSLKTLSEHAGGLAPSFLFNIENGRKVPSEDVAARIAQALDDSAWESTYRAWALVKSRGRIGRRDHDELARAWELLRTPFGESSPATSPVAPAVPRVESGDATRLSVPVLATGVDPGDGVRPPAERVLNTLKLDPSMWGRDAGRARERLVRLRRPFAFALDAGMAAHTPRLLAGYLAIVTRDAGAQEDGTVRPDEAYVVRVGGRLEVASGAVLRGEQPAIASLEALSPAARREAVIGRIDLLLPAL